MSKFIPEYDYVFKIIVVGDSGVGKSSFVLRYTDHIYNDSYISTIGVDFKIRTIEVEGKKVKLQLWDTAGQERFRTIIQSYYRGCQGAIIVFDLTDRTSFYNIDRWCREIQQYSAEGINLLLVGNKCDLKCKREVPIDDGEAKAKQLCMTYLETSAKSNHNVNETFMQITKEIIRDYVGNRLDNSDKTTIKINGENINDEKKRKCC